MNWKRNSIIAVLTFAFATLGAACSSSNPEVVTDPAPGLTPAESTATNNDEMKSGGNVPPQAPSVGCDDNATEGDTTVNRAAKPCTTQGIDNRNSSSAPPKDPDDTGSEPDAPVTPKDGGDPLPPTGPESYGDNNTPPEDPDDTGSEPDAPVTPQDGGDPLPPTGPEIYGS